MALVAISITASLLTCALVYRLYGGWVAAAFAVINYQWIQLSVVGGSEPLFMILLYGSLLAARFERWPVAALLASLATVVRPVGIIALLCFAAMLLWRRQFRQVVAITVVGLLIGALYVTPVRMVLGSPFPSFTAYQEDWGASGWPLTYPFAALVPSYLELPSSTRWTMVVFSCGWPVLAVVGTTSIWVHRKRETVGGITAVEALLLSAYVLFLICYNFRGIIGAFPRYLLPVLPLVLLALRDWIPMDRRLIWGMGVLSALLASSGVVGFRNVFGFRLP